MAGRLMNARSRNRIAHAQDTFPQLDRPSVHRLPFQPSITIMGTRHLKRTLRAFNRQIEGTGSARNAKRAPYFRRVLAVDLDRIMRGRRALPGPPRPEVVRRDARVGENAHGAQGKLERERVGMRMAGNVVGTDGCCIEEDLPPVAANPDVAAGIQSQYFVIGRRTDREAQGARTGTELRRCQSDPESRVVEKRYVPVRMAHRGEPREHPAGDIGPAIVGPGRNDRRENPAHREEIENVLEDDRVIHRAAFEVSAVGQNLLGELPFEDSKTSG